MSAVTEMLDKAGRAEAIRALDALTGGDPEGAHGEADEILLKWLTDLNETDVVNAYLEARGRVGFWYA